MTSPATSAIPAPDARPLRADARRNRERILKAARAVFADQGIDAQIDDVAKRAKVGVGTVYRHFPTKEQLLDAIVREHFEAIAEMARGALGAATAVASATGGVLLGLFFAILAMHYVLRNWQKVSDRAQQTLPMRPEYTADLFAEFRRVGRTTLVGAMGTAIAQGVFATIGYWISGVTEPAFFGAATAVASFIPVVGVLTVIVPVAITLFALGMPGHAAIEIVWSLVTVVGLCDYVIRPRLTRGETEAPALVTFIALFGGVEVFGLKGLIVGPVLMAVALAVLRLYAKEARALRGGV
jgi:predicted PurR-regulated permease PerM